MTAKLNRNQLSKIEETLEDFKVLLIRYRNIRGNENKLKQFFVRNRPILHLKANLLRSI